MDVKKGYIYVIINKLNGKYYFGKSFNVKSRWTAHLRNAKNKVNRHLYDAINHYGKDNFQIFILNEYTASNKTELTKILNEKETYLIKITEATNSQFGYNMTFGGDGGYLGEEAVKKMAQKKRGIPLSQEHKDKIGKGNKGKTKGRKLPEKTKQKIREKLKGKTYEELHGKEMAQKIKDRKRNALKGKKRPKFSKEWRENIGKAQKGKSWEERMGNEKANEMRKNQSIRLQGNKFSFKEIDVDKIKLLIENGTHFTEIPKILNISMTAMNYKFREKYNMTPYQYSLTLKNK